MTGQHQHSSLRPGFPTRLVLRSLARISGASGRLAAVELEREFIERTGASEIRARYWLFKQSTGVLLHSIKDQIGGRKWGAMNGTSKRSAGLETILNDVRLALRSIARYPTHAVAVILTLGLAIGVNTGVFSVINGVLLRPLPYPDQSSLVLVNRFSEEDGSGPASYLDYLDWKAGSSSFSEWGAFGGTSEVVERGGSLESWEGAGVTPEVFRILGVQPLLGRFFTESEGTPGSGTAMLISEELWRSEFGADSSIIGERINFEDESLVVVGVMPSYFNFPTQAEQFWTPIDGTYLENRRAWFLTTVARLKPGVTREMAEAEVRRIAAGVDSETDQLQEDSTVEVRDYTSAVVQDHTFLLFTLAAAVALVLTIACANLANLALTKATSRTGENAIRRALGAGTLRILSQSLVENIVLALLGGLVAIGIGIGVMNFLIAFGPQDLPRRDTIGFDMPVILFTTAVALVSGLLFGIGPAIHAARSGTPDALRHGARAGVSRSRVKLLRALAGTQIALAVALTAGAGLLLNSFIRLSNVDPGFQSENVLSVRIRLPTEAYREQAAIDAFHDNARARLAALPGVELASYTSSLPQSPASMWASYYLPETGPDEEYEGGYLEIVDGEYFRTMGVPLLAGRVFDGSESPDNPLQILVSRSFATTHWGIEDAIGKQVTLDDEMTAERMMTVIGVVGDVHRNGLDQSQSSAMYFSRKQFSGFYGFVSGRLGFLVLRTDGSEITSPDLIKNAIQSIEPRALVTDQRWMRDRIDTSLSTPRFRALIVVTFSGLALLMALIGIYGVMSFGVNQRVREMAVRVALGASPGAVLRHVTGSGMKIVVPGLVVGIVATLIGGRLLASMLFGIEAGDPVTLVAVSAMAGTLGLTACLVPARRAASIDPINALKSE